MKVYGSRLVQREENTFTFVSFDNTNHLFGGPVTSNKIHFISVTTSNNSNSKLYNESISRFVEFLKHKID